LVVWAVVQPLLLYAPFNLQRRLSMGLYFPLAILAVIALNRYVRPDRFNLAFILLLALSLPSNLLVMGSGLATLNSEAGELSLGKDELASYYWLATHGLDDELVLANAKLGNRIPAFSNQRVLYGHPFETPHAELQNELVNSLLSPGRESETVLAELEHLGVRYVLVSASDRAGGVIEWLDEIDMVFEDGAYAIYEISK
jgi:hypothetical protein